MMNLSALKVDPEFQGKIPPLTFEELNQLEANILRDGRIINPIIVWQGLIVDGHNRYTIAKKHPEIPFTVHEKEFASRYEAIIWICKNQLGRRNLTPEQKKYLIGKQYEAEKCANGGDRKSPAAKSGSQIGNLIGNPKTCKRIATENGVSKNTVIRAEEFAKGVDAEIIRDIQNITNFVDGDYDDGHLPTIDSKPLDVQRLCPTAHSSVAHAPTASAWGGGATGEGWTWQRAQRRETPALQVLQNVFSWQGG